MTACKKPIHRTMLRYGIFFLVILCILISAQSYAVLRSVLTQRYNAHTENVLEYIEHITDVDDLQECIKTGVSSPKRDELQRQFNIMVDDYDLLFIYVLIPVDDGQGTVINIISSTNEEERANGETDLELLFTTSDYYSAEQLRPYIAAMQKPGEFSSFLADSDEYGHTQTVCKPLVASNGETIGLLCGDIGHGELHQAIAKYVISSMLLIILIVALFGVLVYFWLRRNVTEPLRMLESAASSFAANSRGKRDLSELTFNTPDLHSENEIQALSDAITQMSEDMKHYVQDILAAESRAESAEEQINDLSKAVNEDVLTGAWSKAAYDAKKLELAKTVDDGTAEFALIGVELEGVDRINDLHGRDARNNYIINAYKLIHGVFPETPVYRIADSIFAVFLEGVAYEERDLLLDALNEKIRESEDPNRNAWECCSAVTGMTEFAQGAEEDVGKVCRRLEMIMSRNWRIRRAEDASAVQGSNPL